MALGAAARTAARVHVEASPHPRGDRADPRRRWLAGGVVGLRIGFLTGLHRGSTVSPQDVAGAVELVMARQPDLIIIGSDYVTNRDRRFVQPAADAGTTGRSAWGICRARESRRRARRARGASVSRFPGAAGCAGLRLHPQRACGHRRSALLDAPAWPTSLAWFRGASPTLMLIAHTPKRLVEAVRCRSVPLRSYPRRSDRSPGHRGGGRARSSLLDRRRRAPRNATVFVSRGGHGSKNPRSRRCRLKWRSCASSRSLVDQRGRGPPGVRSPRSGGR